MYPPALYATPATDAVSHGSRLAQVAELMGLKLYGWQRQGADVALERDEFGRYRFRTVGVSVGRQSGKTTLAAARIALELLAGRHVAYTAQDRAMARLKWEATVEALRPAFGTRFEHERRANGSETIGLNGGSFRVVTPSKEGARGLTLDLVVIDEAMAHGMELIAALGPTMATRPDAQLWMMSNAGTHKSTMLQHYRDLGRAGDSPSLAWFEWAASEADDPDDPEVWARAIPTLGESGGVSIEAVTDFHNTMSMDLFDREILNRWPLDVTDYAIDIGAFSRLATLDAMHGEKLSIGVDIHPSRDCSSIAIASLDEEGKYFVELVDHRDGVGWVAQRLVELATRWNATVTLDVGSAAASLLPHLHGIELLELGARKYAAACGTFYDAVQDGLMQHLGDPILTDAVASATRRRLGDAWAWKRTSDDSPITPLVAASLAAWGALSVAPTPTPQVH